MAENPRNNGIPPSNRNGPPSNTSWGSNTSQLQQHKPPNNNNGRQGYEGRSEHQGNNDPGGRGRGRGRGRGSGRSYMNNNNSNYYNGRNSNYNNSGRNNRNNGGGNNGKPGGGDAQNGTSGRNNSSWGQNQPAPTGGNGPTLHETQQSGQHGPYQSELQSTGWHGQPPPSQWQGMNQPYGNQNLQQHGFSNGNYYFGNPMAQVQNNNDRGGNLYPPDGAMYMTGGYDQPGYGSYYNWPMQQAPPFGPPLGAPPGPPPSYFQSNQQNNHIREGEQNEGRKGGKYVEDGVEYNVSEDGAMKATSPKFAENRMDPQKRWADQESTPAKAGPTNHHESTQNKDPSATVLDEATTLNPPQEESKVEDPREEAMATVSQKPGDSNEVEGSNPDKGEKENASSVPPSPREMKRRFKQKEKKARQKARKKAEKEKEREMAQASGNKGGLVEEYGSLPKITEEQKAMVPQDGDPPPPPLTDKMVKILSGVRSGEYNLTREDIKGLGKDGLSFLTSMAAYEAHALGEDGSTLNHFHTVAATQQEGLLLETVNDVEVAGLLIEAAKLDTPYILNDMMTPSNAAAMYTEHVSRSIEDGSLTEEEGCDVIRTFLNRFWEKGASEIIRRVENINDMDELHDLINEPGALKDFIRAEGINAEFAAPRLVILPPQEYTPLKMKEEDDKPLSNEEQQPYVILTNFDTFKARPSKIITTKNFPGSTGKSGQSLTEAILGMHVTKGDGSTHPSPFTKYEELGTGLRISLKLYGNDPSLMSLASTVILANLPEILPDNLSIGIGLNTDGLVANNNTTTSSQNMKQPPTSILKTPVKEKAAEKPLRVPLKDLKVSISSAWRDKSKNRLQRQRAFLLGKLQGYLEGFLPHSVALLAFAKLMDMSPEELLKTMGPAAFNLFLTRVAQSPKKHRFGSTGTGSNQTYMLSITVKSKDEREGFGGGSLGEMAEFFVSNQQELAKEYNHHYQMLAKTPSEDGTYEIIDTNEDGEWDYKKVEKECYDIYQLPSGYFTSFTINVLSSYKGMSGSRTNPPLTGKAASFARARLTSMGMKHYQSKRTHYGDVPAVFFQQSYLTDNQALVKAEFISMFPNLDPLIYRVGVSQIQVGETSDHVSAMAVLTDKQHQEEVRTTMMSMNEGHTAGRIATRGYIPVSTAQDTPEEVKELKDCMAEYREWNENQVSVRISGMPPQTDINHLIPEKSPADPTGNDRNMLPVIQLMVQGPLMAPSGEMIRSPLDKITPSDSHGIILLHGKRENGKAIIEYAQTVLVYLPGWLKNEELKKVPRLNYERLEEKLGLKPNVRPQLVVNQEGRRLITPSKTESDQPQPNSLNHPSSPPREDKTKVVWTSPLEASQKKHGTVDDSPPTRQQGSDSESNTLPAPENNHVEPEETATIKEQISTKLDGKLAAAAAPPAQKEIEIPAGEELVIPPEEATITELRSKLKEQALAAEKAKRLAISLQEEKLEATLTKEATIRDLRRQLEEQTLAAENASDLAASLQEERSNTTADDGSDETVSKLRQQVAAMTQRLCQEQLVQNELERKIEKITKDYDDFVPSQLSQELVDTAKLLLDRLNQVGTIRTITTIDNTSAPSTITSEHTQRNDSEITDGDIQRVLKRAHQRDAEHQAELRQLQQECYDQIVMIREEYDNRGDRENREHRELYEGVNATILVLLRRLELISGSQEIQISRHHRLEEKMDRLIAHVGGPLSEYEKELDEKYNESVQSFQKSLKAVRTPHQEQERMVKSQSDEIKVDLGLGDEKEGKSRVDFSPGNAGNEVGESDENTLDPTRTSGTKSSVTHTSPPPSPISSISGHILKPDRPKKGELKESNRPGAPASETRPRGNEPPPPSETQEADTPQLPAQTFASSYSKIHQAQLRCPEGFELVNQAASHADCLLSLIPDSNPWPCAKGIDCFNRSTNAIAMEMVLLNVIPGTAVIVVDVSEEDSRVEVESLDSFFQSGQLLSTGDRDKITESWNKGYMPVILIIPGPGRIVRQCKPLGTWQEYFRGIHNVMGQVRSLTISSDPFRSTALGEEFNRWYKDRFEAMVVAGKFDDLLRDYLPGSLGDSLHVNIVEHGAQDSSETSSTEHPQQTSKEKSKATKLGPNRRRADPNAEDDAKLAAAIQRSLIDNHVITNNDDAQSALAKGEPIYAYNTPIRKGVRKSGSPMGNIGLRGAASAPPRVLRTNDDRIDESPTEGGESSDDEVLIIKHRADQEADWQQERDGAGLDQDDEDEPLKCVECNTRGIVHPCSGTTGRRCSNMLHESCATSITPFQCKFCVRRSRIGTTAESDDDSRNQGDDSSPAKSKPVKDDWEESSSSESGDNESPYRPDRLTANVLESIGSKKTTTKGRRIIRNQTGNKATDLATPSVTKRPVLPRSAKKQKRRTGEEEPG